MHIVVQRRLCVAPGYWLKHRQNGELINKILCDSALYHLILKEPDIALGRIEDSLALSRLFSPDYSSSSCHFSLMARMLAYQRLNIITSYLSDDELRAQRPRIQSLMETLINESAHFTIRGKTIPYIYAEANEFNDEHFENGGWLIKPFLQTVINHETQTSLQLNRLLTQPTYPSPVLGLHWFMGCYMNRSSIPFERYSHYYDYCVQNFYFHMSYSHATALHLACRLYRLDNGYFPGKLDDLVPKYLSQVPLDSANSVPTPIQYKTLSDPVIGIRPVLIFNSAVPNDPGPTPYAKNLNPDSLNNMNSRQYIDLVWNPALEKNE